MPRGSEALTRARKEEIINACATLYQTMSFKDITIKEIGKVTSLTRTSIYTYFQTKEEIFLALLQREYELWQADLDRLRAQNPALSPDAFASALAHTLEKRAQLLKIMSMNHYDMEGSSRMENLVAFKVAYSGAVQGVRRCLEHFFPGMTPQDIQDFLYVFFPFLFGVYPYTVVTDKQREALDKAGANYVFYSLYDLTYTCVKRLLEGFLHP